MRIWRIELIGLIAPIGATAAFAGPGSFFWNSRSGCCSRGSEPYHETNKTKSITAYLVEM
jgi:hypothetical protein